MNCKSPPPLIADVPADNPALAKSSAPANPAKVIAVARVVKASAPATLVNAESNDVQPKSV
ncbi:uncharacterized protein SOCG_04260 [Schizosaccharomyces octosporus yFS286]|uniref:Uncharacterized protein n=1 Tax=Schizosaccharomyces octosporus (strain yFS286) TaxID=483514 RepID=S9PN80_SCHOY|nr:uncharacterized protein SOCG_04260 [Schizosaccharomyces octosporus yFS286]EPX70696.1 hypothetical protein SOCG_04260 [Schizosaccharomyces octosporus yFS286]